MAYHQCSVQHQVLSALDLL